MARAQGSVPAYAPVQQQYIPFLGGLDTSADRLKVQPSLVYGAMNYEAQMAGGYRRIGGYERFDGRARPSDATYRGMNAVATWACSVGDTLTGATSGATAVVAYKNAGSTWLAATDVTGTFSVGETVNVSGTPVGVYTGDTEQVDSYTQNTILAAAADVYRARIQQVPGSGPVRGLAVLAGSLYAWRDNVGGTACAIWKATSTGWQAVPLYYELSFSGATTEPAEGATVTKGAVSATVKRVVLESGAYVGGTAAGRLIITAPVGGSFTAGAFTGGMTATVTAAKLGTAITLSPGGDYSLTEGTFVAGVPRLYGCDGVNREFEFDGQVLVPLETGTGSVRASCVAVHARQLWFAYKHAVQHSAIAFPYMWTALAGAAELGVNSTITNLISVAGDATNTALMIYSTKGVHVVYGTSDLDYNLVLLSGETGADYRSAQPMRAGISCSRNGFRLSESAQTFDNFSFELASQRIDGYTQLRVVSCSQLQRSRSMVRYFFSDGTGLSGVLTGSSVQWMPINYGVKVVRTWSCEINGVERLFMASDSADQAFVYEQDVGRSFDGAAIEAWMLLHPFTARAPAVRKTFRNVTLEASGESPFTLYVSAEFNYGDPDEMISPQQALNPNGAAMRWDVSAWDQANWDGVYATRLRFETRGSAVAMGLNAYSNSAVELPHTLHGETVSYTVRRIQR